MNERYDVIIVGGGPVGVALAVELGQRSVSCALVERHQTPVQIPKGQNLTNRTLEHFYFWNCVDELRDARIMPRGYPIGGMTAYGNLISPYWWAQTGGNGRTGSDVADFFFQRNERLPQYCSESVLRTRLQALPSVTTLFGWQAGKVTQDDNAARVAIFPADDEAFYSWSVDTEQQVGRAARPDSGEARTLEAQYLIGCDGGRSLVRDTLGIERTGRSFDQRMMLAVLRSKELHEGLKRFPEGTTYRVLKPELKGFWQFFGRIDVGEGFFFHAPVPPDTRQDNFDFHALLQSVTGFPFKAEFDHVGFWDLRVMVAGQYRRSRLLIAGDAAHQHPPYGGFGLNTGLEDAANLGWKLAARVQGWGGEALIESYELERRPIFLETGEAVIAGGIDRDRDFLERYSPEKDRAEFERAWAELGNSRNALNRGYEPNYEGSQVMMGPSNGVTTIFGEHTHAAKAGHHLSPRVLSSGRNVYEELGRNLTLLAFGADEAATGGFEATARSLNVPLTVVRDRPDGDCARYEARLVLVRPDQYVVWAANEAPPEPAQVLKRVTGQA